MVDDESDTPEKPAAHFGRGFRVPMPDFGLGNLFGGGGADPIINMEANNIRRELQQMHDLSKSIPVDD